MTPRKAGRKVWAILALVAGMALAGCSQEDAQMDAYFKGQGDWFLNVEIPLMVRDYARFEIARQFHE
jgi:hypothetical protein